MDNVTAFAESSQLSRVCRVIQAIPEATQGRRSQATYLVAEMTDAAELSGRKGVTAQEAAMIGVGMGTPA